MPGAASCASRSALAGLQEAAEILGISEADLAETATELEPHLVQHLVPTPSTRLPDAPESPPDSLPSFE